eukprot:12358866-Prorocentrum_lima.AAC.1
MTSSLVGSEMCIRDSSWHLATDASVARNTSSACATRCLAASTSRVLAPVSYTHLTLPTICSV